LCSTKVLSQEDSKVQKEFFSLLQMLAIYVVNSFESLSTQYFNNKKQDPIVESQKK
jgi:hypothetical protein